MRLLVGISGWTLRPDLHVCNCTLLRDEERSDATPVRRLVKADVGSQDLG